MTRYRVMYWHDIPYQVKAKDNEGTVKQTLPPRFMQAINSAAIARQKHDNNAYMTGWRWSKKESSSESAKVTLQRLAEQLERDFSSEGLRQCILAHAKKENS